MNINEPEQKTVWKKDKNNDENKENKKPKKTKKLKENENGAPEYRSFLATNNEFIPGNSIDNIPIQSNFIPNISRNIPSSITDSNLHRFKEGLQNMKENFTNNKPIIEGMDCSEIGEQLSKYTHISNLIENLMVYFDFNMNRAATAIARIFRPIIPEGPDGVKYLPSGITYDYYLKHLFYNDDIA